MKRTFKTIADITPFHAGWAEDSDTMPVHDVGGRVIQQGPVFTAAECAQIARMYAEISGRYINSIGEAEREAALYLYLFDDLFDSWAGRGRSPTR